MHYTYLILTLLTVFISSTLRAQDSAKLKSHNLNFIHLASIDGVCHKVDLNDPLGFLPRVTGPLGTDIGCEVQGFYGLIKEQNADAQSLWVDYRGHKIPDSQVDAGAIYGSNMAWFFNPNDLAKANPVALAYSVYTDQLVDLHSNTWEPKETQILVALKGLKTCIVGEIDEQFNSETAWSKALNLVQDFENLKCLN